MEAEDEPTSIPGFTSRPDAHNGVSGSDTVAVVEREGSAVSASALSTLLIALCIASVTSQCLPLSIYLLSLSVGSLYRVFFLQESGGKETDEVSKREILN